MAKKRSVIEPKEMNPDLKVLYAAWNGLSQAQKLHIMIMVYEGIKSVGIDETDDFMRIVLSAKLAYLARFLDRQDGLVSWSTLPDEKKRKMVVTVYRLAFAIGGGTKEEIDMLDNFLKLPAEVQLEHKTD